MQQNIMKTIRKKRRLWRWFCTIQDYESYKAYKKVESQVKSVVHEAKRDFEKKLARNIKANPKSFYKYINSRSKTQSKAGPLKDKHGNIQTDDLQQATILN